MAHIHRNRGRILARGSLFNAALGLALLLPQSACKNTPEVADGGAPDAARPALPPPPSVALAPASVMAGLPHVPAIVGIKPGDTLEHLRKTRPKARPSDLTPALYLEDLPPDGPFRIATYVLTRDGSNRVESVLITLSPDYAHPTHVKALADSLTERLGQGEAVKHEGYEGWQWALPDYRIELRQDTRNAGEVDLVFDLRGARKIEMP